jgi:glucose-6-phosphate 1-epimerase
MNLAAVPELDRRFGIPGVARVVEGYGGLAKVAITSPAAAGEMYLHGAHVTSWQPRDAQEVLFVSSQSRWEDGRAIRGGIPICFPWFADKADDPSAPAHGFVRTKAWRLESIVRNGDAVTIVMSTQSDAGTKKWWPADFHLGLCATFGFELQLELVVTNTGSTELRFEEALHSYFRVRQIEKVRLHGLDKVPYLDKTDLNRERTQDGAVAFVSETDRVYLNTQDPIDVEDASLNRHIHIVKTNSFTTVLWNPWVQKARNMSDFGDDEWMRMVCVETSNVSDFAVKLAPGQEHTMRAIVRSSDLNRA